MTRKQKVVVYVMIALIVATMVATCLIAASVIVDLTA
jgi:hypothetical protein